MTVFGSGCRRDYKSSFPQTSARVPVLAPSSHIEGGFAQARLITAPASERAGRRWRGHARKGRASIVFEGGVGTLASPRRSESSHVVDRDASRSSIAAARPRARRPLLRGGKQKRAVKPGAPNRLGATR